MVGAGSAEVEPEPVAAVEMVGLPVARAVRLMVQVWQVVLQLA